MNTDLDARGELTMREALAIHDPSVRRWRYVPADR
jgi:hypothetical protein